MTMPSNLPDYSSAGCSAIDAPHLSKFRAMCMQAQCQIAKESTSMQSATVSGRRWKILVAVLLSFILGAALGFKASLLGFHPFLLCPSQDTGSNPLAHELSCSPKIVNPRGFATKSLSSWLVHARFSPPVFRNKSMVLCDAIQGESSGWTYCLPISGRKDIPFCSDSVREALLQPQTRETRCFASVLHMLLMDVYEEMERLDLNPALLYGTLLGAVRENRIIPFTEDVDIGWQMTVRGARQLQTSLAGKGYHMLLRDIWRVCVAPTHPLAGNLYDANMDLVQGPMEVPYVDLYEMKRVNESIWRISEASPSQNLPAERI